MTTVVGSLLDEAWRLAPSVALRPESFGALAYNFGNRKLIFLKRPELVTVVRGLEGHDDVRSALAKAGVAEGLWSAYEAALRQLAAVDMIRPRGGKRSPRRAPPASRPASGSLAEQFEFGLDAPICLTWELTYACNLACVHCLSSSGRRDPRELTTVQCEAVVEELQRMGVFYVNIGGGEPTIRADFWHLLEYAVGHQVGVKFSTNGVRITPERARFLASAGYVDVQVSLDGANAEVNDHLRGAGSYDMAVRALDNLATAGFQDAKLSVVVTRRNVDQLDDFQALADRFGARLRLTRLRPSGRGADVWDELHLLPAQQRGLYDWLMMHGDGVLTGDSFFHLAAFGEKLPGLNLCGAGRVVCLIDPVGDVYACPFAIHDTFLGGNVLTDGGFQRVWQTSPLFKELRSPQTSGACTSCHFFESCRGGCMAAKFFTGLPVDGPDPECVQGYGQAALAGDRLVPAPGRDHSRRTPTRDKPVLVQLSRREDLAVPPVPACAEHPLAGFALPPDLTQSLRKGLRMLKNPWASNPWFESVAVAQRRARKRLPSSVYAALLAGSERGQSYQDNMAAFAELGFAPHIVGPSAERTLATSVMGQDIALPVLISPTGVQAVHPDGEVAVARAAAARGTAIGLSSFASKPVEEVTTANPKTFFQMYWMGSKDDMEARMDRARAAGAVGLIATLDWSFAIGRDWGSPEIPEKIDLHTALRFAPQVLSRPQWLSGFARAGRLPDLTAPNLARSGQVGPTFFGAYYEWMQTPAPTWEDVGWLRKQWDGPFMLKGICRVDDARRAVDAGCTAISVSNHGGNNLDGTPAPIRVLKPVADAVGGDIELLLDGGIRRGSDVVKALCLGARAVMVGRACLWGLAANGQAGVENVLDILRGGIDSALLAMWVPSVHDLVPEHLVIPEGFHRALGSEFSAMPAP